MNVVKSITKLVQCLCSKVAIYVKETAIAGNLKFEVVYNSHL